ncbi:hypothetical protein [Streptomyces sp. NPDC127084]|uniref:hypothetical protein n=1 Tax=Streptomyces sp. NPDC127084 TaxID=3347133 RepID=UPI0036651AC1
MLDLEVLAKKHVVIMADYPAKFQGGVVAVHKSPAEADRRRADMNPETLRN